MRNCPKCGAVVDGQWCQVCGEGKPTPVVETTAKGKAREPSEESLRAAEARRLFESVPPTADDLTPQQWYNVCKFLPSVAEHCKRQRFDVGPDRPLDKTSQLGPLLRGFRAAKPKRDPEAEAERAAIQGEAA